MTEHCTRNISPDGMTGTILALEGMQDTIVLLNGPMGCKFYHSTTSQFLTIRPPLYLPSEDGETQTEVNYNFLNHWFFRQSRVPCTYLDGYDYVYGTTEKVQEAVRYLKDNIAFSCLAVVNSPGASLIGDNLAEAVRDILPDRPVVLIESPGYSTHFAEGYETALLEVIRQILPVPRAGKRRKSDAADTTFAGNTRKKTVNLLGLSLWQRYCEGDIQELTRLFALCDIQVGCCVFAGNTPEELQSLAEADLNVVLYPEMAESAAVMLSEKYGVPYYVCPSLPIGFAAVEQIFCEICEILGNDPVLVLEESARTRAAAWAGLSGYHQMCGKPNGCSYAVEGNASQVYSYARFLSEYLGMIPDCLEVTDGGTLQQMQRIEELRKIYESGQYSCESMLDTTAELVFGEANTIAALKLKERIFTGIEISRPSMGYIDLVPKTQMGIQGSLFLIEQVLNGLQAI